MPAKPGPMTLLYPEWIPGEHGPTGPMVNLVGLKIEGGRQDHRLEARRREHVRLSPRRPRGRRRRSMWPSISSRRRSPAASPRAVPPPASWRCSTGTRCCSTLRAASPTICNTRPPCASPAAGAMEPRCPSPRESGNEIEFQPASLTTLIDSPVPPARTTAPSTWAPTTASPHYLHLAADSDRALEVSPEIDRRVQATW